MSLQNKEFEIARSDDFYNLTNFFIVTFVLGMLIASPFLISNFISTKWMIFFSLTSFVISFIVSSFFYLNKIKFYDDRIEIDYFIKHSSIKKRKIEVKDIMILKYTYVGGRGSGGNGQLKIYYSDNEKKRKIKCSMDKTSAAKVCLVMKTKGIPIEIKPLGVLDRYGYS